MQKPLLGSKVAVLVANGFEEKDLTACQRVLTEAGASIKIISTDQGLVSGWSGSNWGPNHAVDTPLNAALGVDYSSLIVPDGEKSIHKLMLSGHTKRFISSFIVAFKPVALFGSALDLLDHIEMLSSRTVSGPEEFKEKVEGTGASWSDEPVHIDENLLTGDGHDETRALFVSTLLDHFVHNARMAEVA